jgi:hypothetical protein
VAGLKKHPVTGEGLPAYGTNILTNVLNEAGGYPALNFSVGRFDTSAKISGETQAELENKRGGKGSATHGCHKGCIIRCSGTFYDKNGHFLSKQPEYETVWAHGGHCGIDDLETIAFKMSTNAQVITVCDRECDFYDSEALISIVRLGGYLARKFELVREIVDQKQVEIFSTQVGIIVGGLDLEDPVTDCKT